MTLPNHLFVSSDDGALYDTRVTYWNKRPPLRACYRSHRQKISNTAEFKAALRAGPYAWPGGYPLYFILADGCALSFDGAKGNLREVLRDMTDPDGQWRVVGLEVNYEDTDLCCEHTGERIEVAYA